MKKYCLLFMSGLTCLMEEEREMILHDEQMLRQGMDEDGIRNRMTQLQEEHKQLLAARGQVLAQQDNTGFLQNLLSEAIRRNRTRYSYEPQHVTQQQEPQHVSAGTLSYKTRELRRQKVRDHFGNYDKRSLYRIMDKTQRIYEPLILMETQDLPEILKRLLHMALARYSLVYATLDKLAKDYRRQITCTVDQNAEDNIPVFVQFVW